MTTSTVRPPVRTQPARNPKPTKILAATLALAALALTLCGCQPDDAIPFFFEDFETSCDGTPCGWGVTEGSTGRADWVETLHPGEHALRLEGAVTARLETAAGELPVMPCGQRFVVSATLRCDVPSSLLVEIAVGDQRRTLRLPADESWAEATDDAWNPLADDAQVSHVVLENDGAACEVGELVVEPLPEGPAAPFPPPGGC